MKKVLKIVGIIISIPIILFAVAAFGLASIDLNNYRSEIEQLVADNTGRNLSLKGDLKKSFFPWLGIEVGAVALSNAKGFEPADFASVNQVEIKIDTVSLLKLEPKIDRIIIKGLNLNLAKNKDGISNWADLSKTAPTDGPAPGETETGKPDQAKDVTKPETAKSPQLPLFHVAGITIENANVQWHDQQTGSSYAVKQLNLSVSEVSLNKPVALEMDFELSSSEPALNARVDLASEKVEWDLTKQRYAVSPITLSVRASGDALPASPLAVQMQTNATVNLSLQLLDISELTLKAMGLTLQGNASVTQLIDAPQYQSEISIAKFNPRSLLQKLSIELPPMADDKALSAVTVQTKFKGDTNQIEMPELQVALDDTQLDASASVKNFAKPSINAALNLDKINLDRYLPPVTEGDVAAKPESSTASASQTAQSQPLPVPVDLIRSLDAVVNLKAGKLVIKELDVDNAVVKAKVKNSVASLSPVRMDVASGSLQTDVTLDVSKKIPLYRVKQTIDQVQAAPLIKAVAGDDYVSGLLMLRANIDSKGILLDEVKKNLNGNFSFLFKDGAVKGVNFGEMLRKAKAKLDKEEYVESKDPKTTDFAELGGSATIKNGVIHNRDLSAKSPLLRVDGKGKVDLVNENLDYLVTTNLVGTSKGQGGKSIEELKGIPIPIQLTGPFSDIQWDYKWSVITKALKAKLKKKAKKKIETKKQEVKQKAKQELEQKKEEKKEEIKDAIEDKLKEKFKKLF